MEASSPNEMRDRRHEVFVLLTSKLSDRRVAGIVQACVELRAMGSASDSVLLVVPTLGSKRQEPASGQAPHRVLKQLLGKKAR